MQFKKTLDAIDQYSIDNLGRICPIYKTRWSKIPWKDAATLDDAILAIAESPVFEADAFPPNDDIRPEEWDGLRAKMYLDIEEGFFLAVGANVSNAVFCFQWGEQIFFNIRPDFGYLSLATGLMEPPINAAEAKIRSWLCDYTLEVDAIQRAIQAKEIDPNKLYSIKKPYSASILSGNSPLRVWELSQSPGDSQLTGMEK